MNEWMNERWFYLRAIKNELKAGLVIRTRQLKEDNESTETTLSGTESVKAVRLKSSRSEWIDGGKCHWWHKTNNRPLYHKTGILNWHCMQIRKNYLLGLITNNFVKSWVSFHYETPIGQIWGIGTRRHPQHSRLWKLLFVRPVSK